MKKVTICLSLLLLGALAGAVEAAPLFDDLLLHYRADSLGLTDGAVVSSWKDVAYANLAHADLGQWNSYGYPTFVTDAWNGFPAVKFEQPVDPGTAADSEKQFLYSGSTRWNYPEGSTPVTIFLVCTGGNSTVAKRALRVGRDGGATGRVIDCTVSGAPHTSGARFNNGYAETTQTPFATDEWHIGARRALLGTDTISGFTYWVNGTKQTLDDIGSPDNPIRYQQDNNIIMGGATNSSGGLLQNEIYSGRIAEVLIYNYLTDAQVEEVSAFLHNKYYHLMAHTPSPVNFSVDQGTVQESATPGEFETLVTLSWETANASEADSNPNADVANHYLYISNSEPNVTSRNEQPIIIPAGTNSYGPVALNVNTKYYWCIDEYLTNPGNSNITGDVWTFTTRKALPKVVTQADNVVIFPGETAVMAPVLLIPEGTDPNFAWYKTPQDNKTTPEDDILVGMEETLSIQNAQYSDEGYYYCAISNNAMDPGDEPVTTDTRMIGIKREMAHWTLDSADYFSGQYLDISATDTNKWNIDPNRPTVAGSFKPGKINEALDLTVEPQTAGLTDPVWMSAYTDHVTATAWIKWAGPSGQDNGIVSNRASALDPNPSQSNWFFLIEGTPGDAALNKLKFNLDGSTVITADITADEWHHVAATVGPEGQNLYIDGEVVAENTNTTTVYRRYNAPVYLGSNNRDETGMIATFNGQIDDVRIYNYQLDQYGIVDLYYAVEKKPLCLNKDNLDMTFDVTGPEGTPDCVINILDLAQFVNDWLACGIYPDCFN